MSIFGLIKPLYLYSLTGLLMLFSSLACSDNDEPPLKLEFIQQLDFQPEGGKQQLLGISSIRYIPSDDASSGRLILLSDDTGAVENKYGLYETPHLFNVDIHCGEMAGEDRCKYDSVISRDNIDYNPAFLEAGLNESQIDSNQLWCSVYFLGSFINSSSPICQTDIEGIELLGSGQRLVMEEQVVGASYSTPGVLRMDETNKVINKYSFPFAAFGFERNWSNENTLETGVKPNGGFEGIAELADEKNRYATVTEFPLKQDKPRNRFIVFSLEDSADGNSDEVSVQEHYYYNVDKVLPDNPEEVKKGYPKTGVSDILAVDAEYRQFITIERTAIRYNNSDTIKSVNKLFIVSLPDSSDQSALSDTPAQSVIKKELAINSTIMNGFNIEGLTWGPELAGGERTLILVNDNDAGKAEQLTHLFVFKLETS